MVLKQQDLQKVINKHSFAISTLVSQIDNSVSFFFLKIFFQPLSHILDYFLVHTEIDEIRLQAYSFLDFFSAAHCTD